MLHIFKRLGFQDESAFHFPSSPLNFLEDIIVAVITAAFSGLITSLCLPHSRQITSSFDTSNCYQAENF